jgi:hypothetical protein
MHSNNHINGYATIWSCNDGAANRRFPAEKCCASYTRGNAIYQLTLPLRFQAPDPTLPPKCTRSQIPASLKLEISRSKFWHHFRNLIRQRARVLNAGCQEGTSSILDLHEAKTSLICYRSHPRYNTDPIVHHSGQIITDTWDARKIS